MINRPPVSGWWFLRRKATKAERVHFVLMPAFKLCDSFVKLTAPHASNYTQCYWFLSFCPLYQGSVGGSLNKSCEAVISKLLSFWLSNDTDHSDTGEQKRAHWLVVLHLWFSHTSKQETTWVWPVKLPGNRLCKLAHPTAELCACVTPCSLWWTFTEFCFTYRSWRLHLLFWFESYCVSREGT